MEQTWANDPNLTNPTSPRPAPQIAQARQGRLSFGLIEVEGLRLNALLCRMAVAASKPTAAVDERTHRP